MILRDPNHAAQVLIYIAIIIASLIVFAVYVLMASPE
jgi:hypothetical protein